MASSILFALLSTLALLSGIRVTQARIDVGGFDVEFTGYPNGTQENPIRIDYRPGDSVVIYWDQVCLEALRKLALGPPLSARTCTIMHFAIYEAWSAYDATARGPIFGNLLDQSNSGLTAAQITARKSEAISYAAYRSLQSLFGPSSFYAVANNNPNFIDFGPYLTRLGYSTATANNMALRNGLYAAPETAIWAGNLAAAHLKSGYASYSASTASSAYTSLVNAVADTETVFTTDSTQAGATVPEPYIAPTATTISTTSYATTSSTSAYSYSSSTSTFTQVSSTSSVSSVSSTDSATTSTTSAYSFAPAPTSGNIAVVAVANFAYRAVNPRNGINSIVYGTIYPSATNTFFPFIRLSISPSAIGTIAGFAHHAVRLFDGANEIGNYRDYTGFQPTNAFIPTPFPGGDPDNTRVPATNVPFDGRTIARPQDWAPISRLPTREGGIVNQKFNCAQCYNVRPFALEAASENRPPPPVAYANTAAYAELVRVILDYSKNLNDTGKMIAEYWKDGPNLEAPAGTYQLFQEFISRRDGYNVDRDAKAFFTTMACQIDSFLTAWDAKRFYNYARPFSGVRAFKAGQQITAWGGPGEGTKTFAGDLFLPYQQTTFVSPNFPAYVSGHSTQAAAGARCFQLMTGNDVFDYTVKCPKGISTIEGSRFGADPRNIGTPQTDILLKFPTHTFAAEQSGESRYFGGVHWTIDNIAGRNAGYKTAIKSFDKAKSFYVNF